jgi:hypothetical protein
VDQYFGGTFDCELKCVEAEDEPPSFSKENFLQLSCFISQEVRYMLSGLRSVSGYNLILVPYLFVHHETHLTLRSNSLNMPVSVFKIHVS